MAESYSFLLTAPEYRQAFNVSRGLLFADPVPTAGGLVHGHHRNPPDRNGDADNA